MLVGTTDGFMSMYKNAMGGGILHQKLKAENYLRQSGLDYTILRPGELIGHKEIKYFNHPNQIARINQGNWGSIFSYVHRNTVAQTIAKKIVGNSLIPSKLTIEITPNEVQDTQILYDKRMGKDQGDVGEVRVDVDLYTDGYMKWEDLKSDDEASVVTLRHWDKFNTYKLYALFVWAMGWNLMLSLPLFK